MTLNQRRGMIIDETELEGSGAMSIVKAYLPVA